MRNLTRLFAVLSLTSALFVSSAGNAPKKPTCLASPASSLIAFLGYNLQPAQKSAAHMGLAGAMATAFGAVRVGSAAS